MGSYFFHIQSDPVRKLIYSSFLLLFLALWAQNAAAQVINPPVAGLDGSFNTGLDPKNQMNKGSFVAGIGAVNLLPAYFVIALQPQYKDEATYSSFSFLAGGGKRTERNEHNFYVNMVTAKAYVNVNGRKEKFASGTLLGGMWRYNRHFRTRGVFDPYFGFGLGLRASLNSYRNERYLETKITSSPLLIELRLGARFAINQSTAFFTEFGLGHQLIVLGFAYRWDRSAILRQQSPSNMRDNNQTPQPAPTEYAPPY